MLACLGVIVTETGFRWPGYISKTLDLKFEDIPGGALDSWAAVPALGWLQIVAFTVFLELAYGTQDPRKAPGDVGGISWIRYSDPEVKKFKLNVRAAPNRRHSPVPRRPRASERGAAPCGGRVSPDLHRCCRRGGPACGDCMPAKRCALRFAPPADARVLHPSQAERNNGRAAMMGITGMMIHNALGVDALFPLVQ